MDQFLAEYYGTEQGVADGVADDDIEKMAQLTLLTKEAAAEGVDLTEFSDEELVAMAGDLYGAGAAKTAETDETDLEKEAAEKYAEADYLGRVMAHAMNHEAVAIQKEAGLREGGGRFVRRIGKAFGGGETDRAVAGEVARRTKHSQKVQDLAGQFERTPIGAPGEKKLTTRLEKALAERIQQRKLSVGEAATQRSQAVRGAAALAGGVGGVGAAGAGGYAAAREKKSADSAFEQLVVDRANEHLQAAGLLEKEATGDDFETIVDRAALELLEAHGHAVEWY